MSKISKKKNYIVLVKESSVVIRNKAITHHFNVYASLDQIAQFQKPVLHIRYCIRALPLDLFKFTFLTELEIRACGLRKIPKEIGLLVNLKCLNASYNKIKTLPASFGNLKRLKVLDLSKNSLNSFDVEIFDKLTKLYFVDLDDNFIMNPPTSLAFGVVIVQAIDNPWCQDDSDYYQMYHRLLESAALIHDPIVQQVKTLPLPIAEEMIPHLKFFE